LVYKKQVGKFNLTLLMRALYSLLISLKNGMTYERSLVIAPYTHMNFKILTILYKEGFICNFFRPLDYPDQLHVVIRPALGEFFKHLKFFSRHSTLSRRSYYELLPLLKSTRFGLITTSRGVISIREAYKYKVGGRILFTV